jgi:DNA-binding MarR family transcriptional regulator
MKPEGQEGRQAALHCVPASLERSLTQVARAILRLSVPSEGAGEPPLDRAGYWLLVRVSEQAPVRMSDLAEMVDLDLSTVSRQIRDLVDRGLVDKVRDPQDGRASLLSLTSHGAAVLDAVSEARRRVLAEALMDWTEEEQLELARLLARLGTGLPTAHRLRDTAEPDEADQASDALDDGLAATVRRGGDR